MVRKSAARSRVVASTMLRNQSRRSHHVARIRAILRARDMRAAVAVAK